MEKTGRKPKLNMDQLLTRIVALMGRHHPKDLSFSRVARLCEVPRSTLYYYFGSNRQSMINEAAQFSMKTFVQLYSIDNDTQSASWDDFQRKRFAAALEVVRNFPWAPTVYFRYRTDQGEMGQLVRDIEEQYLHKFALAWKKYHGSLPDPRSVRFVAYLKLGLLYGFSMEKELWLDSNGEDQAALDLMIDRFNLMIGQAMSQKF